jgi:outer membrane protein TolC
MYKRSLTQISLLLLISTQWLVAVTNEAGAEPQNAEGDRPALSDGHTHEPIAWVLRGLENNFGLKIDRSELLTSQDRVEVTLGEFVTRFVSQARFSRSERRQNSQEFTQTGRVQGIFDDEVLQLRVGLEQQFTTGARASISNVNTRTINPTTRSELEFSQTPAGFSVRGPAYNPEFQSITVLNVTQPLLQGRGARSTLAENRLARIGVDEAALRVRASAERLIGQILVTYAEVVFARENLKVKQDAVKLAENLVSENRRRVEEGMMSPIDVTQAQARRAEAMEEVVSARVFLRERINRLLGLTQSDFDSSEAVNIRGSVDHLMPGVDADGVEVARYALMTNPAFLAILKRAEVEDVRLAFARDQVLPRLDLEGSLGLNGLGGNFRDSFSDYGSDGRDPDWSVGVTFSVPLDRKAERAQVRIANRAKEQALMEIKQAEIQLLVELENAIQEYRATLERIEFVKESVRLAEEGLRSEERRLASGVTTSYNVLNQQRDLSFARTRALAAEVESFSALVQLYLIKGTLSQMLNLELNTGRQVAFVQ